MFGSPFFSFGMAANISTFRRNLVQFLANFCEEIPLSGDGSMHLMSHDKRYYLWEYHGNCKAFPHYVSGGIINSMMAGIEDITVNAKIFKTPMLVMIAGKERTVSNDAIRAFVTKCGTAQNEKKVIEFPSAYHNIHKEPDCKPRQLSVIYEFIYDRLKKDDCKNFD